ncbi:MAG: inorganic phosphate transporter, PiT family, partial [Chloroflexota bacterium]|nr:inorganic phosphate transporter, PiT family [Chloroflexota bacterium]
MPSGFTLLLILVLVLAVAFDYVNGFHDTANAIATSVSTRALRPSHAILMSATANFLGALTGTAVATTIAKGIATIPDGDQGQIVVCAALLGAIAWNLLTWRLGIPSSSSHALIGGLIGAAIAAVGVSSLNLQGIYDKVLFPLVASPILGVLIGFALMVILLNVFRRAHPKRINDRFRRLQLVSAAFMAFSHGSNDAQKTMGIVTLALVAGGIIPEPVVPLRVILLAATAMSLGTAAGGWRIIRTMGQKVVKLDPVHGFAAETTAATMQRPARTTKASVRLRIRDAQPAYRQRHRHDEAGGEQGDRGLHAEQRPQRAEDDRGEQPGDARGGAQQREAAAAQRLGHV